VCCIFSTVAAKRGDDDRAVIPAKAGIQAALLPEDALMDSRLRGNDGIKSQRRLGNSRLS